MHGIFACTHDTLASYIPNSERKLSIVSHASHMHCSDHRKIILHVLIFIFHNEKYNYNYNRNTMPLRWVIVSMDADSSIIVTSDGSCV